MHQMIFHKITNFRHLLFVYYKLYIKTMNANSSQFWSLIQIFWNVDKYGKKKKGEYRAILTKFLNDSYGCIITLTYLFIGAVILSASHMLTHADDRVRIDINLINQWTPTCSG